MNQVFVSLFILLLALHLILLSKRKLEFKYGLAGLAAYVLLILLLNNHFLLEKLCGVMGIRHLPVIQLITVIFCIFLLLLYVMVSITELQRKVNKIAQENAILKNSLEKR